MNVEFFYPYLSESNKVVIDSRQVEDGDILFAFSGINFNAAEQAEFAISKGALAVVVEDEKYKNEEKNIFYVENVLVFLQNLAKYHREKLQIPIVGLTGSNGKTTTKELLFSVLAMKYNVQFTQGNLNNHIGVPLTLLSIKDIHEFAVIEMGANHQKEIEFLCSLCQPTLGYITNFGKAHLEGFGGFEGIIKGKSELYDYLMENNRTILLNSDDELQVKKTEDYHHLIKFGKANSQYNFEYFVKNNCVGIIYEGKRILSNLTGTYNFTNLCAAITLGLENDIKFELIKDAIEKYEPTNMRSQIIKKREKTLVLDAYNANPSSMKESLLNFKTFSGSKTIIIGDMLELGNESEFEHQEILNLAKQLEFNKIITVGKWFKETKLSDLSFDNVQELLTHLMKEPIDTENILIKGSRGIALEKIVDFI